MVSGSVRLCGGKKIQPRETAAAAVTDERKTPNTRIGSTAGGVELIDRTERVPAAKPKMARTIGPKSHGKSRRCSRTTQPVNLISPTLNKIPAPATATPSAFVLLSQQTP